MKTKAELIEEKVLNILLKSDELEFNRLLEEVPAFAKDYQMALHLSEYIKNDQLFNFRDQLQEIGTNYKLKQSKTKVRSLKQYWKQIASVAAVFLVFVSGYWYANSVRSLNQLYDDYYSVDEVYLNVRSGNTTTTDVLEQGLLLFEKNKFQESIIYFEQLPTSITAVYYCGIAHMEIDEYELAKNKFDQVIEDYTNVFYDQALWYKGLCLLKQEKSEEAKFVFNRIAKSESFYNNQAQELIDKLE